MANFWIGNGPLPPFGTFPKSHPKWKREASLNELYVKIWSIDALPYAVKSCQKPPSVTKICHKLSKVVKSWQKLSKVGKNCPFSWLYCIVGGLNGFYGKRVIVGGFYGFLWEQINCGRL